MTTIPIDQMVANAFGHHRAGDLANAEKLYRSALTADPDNLNALQLLGLLTLEGGNHIEAVNLLTRAVGLLEQKNARAPQYAALYNNFGNALRAAGRGLEAVRQYREGIALDPNLAGIHANLADELIAQGKFENAVASYESAQQFGPLSSLRLCYLGSAYALIKKFSDAEAAFRNAVAPIVKDVVLRQVELKRNGRPAAASNPSVVVVAASRVSQERPEPKDTDGQLGQPTLPLAVEPYRQLMSCIPANPDLYYLFARALREAGDRPAALEIFKLGLEINPEHVACLYDLGVSLGTSGLARLAIPLLEKAIRLKPDLADLHLELGNALHHVGDAERALSCYREANRLQPIRTWRAKTTSPEFSILAIEAPGVGNTPSHFLLKNAAFDCHFIALLAESKPHVDVLQKSGDVVVNLISDVDTGHQVLSVAGDLIGRLSLPVINHPLKVLGTDRQTVAEKLASIPLSRTPKTILCPSAALAGPGAAEIIERNGFTFPILVRVAGTHGGDALEKLNNLDEVKEFCKQYPASEYYVTEFVDYRSHDGFHRKYRFVFVDGEIFPYHLAIGDMWKVHHFRTDMERHAWMQEEEHAFLEHPWQAFSSDHKTALHEIHRAIDLEFFGIDCSLDDRGNILIFEVNASMLVHDDNTALPYKTPYCARIKEAFHRMLARAAGREHKVVA